MHPQDLRLRHVRHRRLHRRVRYREGLDGTGDDRFHRRDEHSRLHGWTAVCAARHAADTAEGRLHKGHDLMKVEQAGDQCTLGCNFDTRRPLRDILADYKAVLEHVFSPTAYAGRLSRLAVMLDRSDRRGELPDGDMRKRLGGIDTVHRIMRALPDVREPFWKTFVEVAKTNPGALRYIVMLMALYLHL